MKAILTIITVSKDGHRRNMNTSFMTSNLDSYRGITNIPYKSNSKVIFLQKYT